MESDQLIIIGLLFLGATLVGLGVIALVLKLTLNRSLTRKVDLFNRVMMQEMERNLDHFRMSLEEQRVMFNSMRESKTKTLVELYSYYSEILTAGRQLTNTRDYAEARRRSKTIAQRVGQFFAFYNQHGIVFTDDFSRYLNHWMGSQRGLIEKLKAHQAFQAGSDEERLELLKQLNGTWDAFSKELEDLGAELKEEYNRMHMGIYKMLPKAPKEQTGWPSPPAAEE